MSVYDWSKGLVKGFFWGGLIGLITGVLFSTRREGGTWKDIGKSADKLYDKTREEIGQVQRKMEELANHKKDSCLGKKET